MRVAGCSGGWVKIQGEIRFPDEAQLQTFANELAIGLKPPLVFWLEGELGVGKTTFARALIHALGYAGRVKSPTYGLLEHYQLGSMQVLHLDLYRINDPGEMEFLGLGDLMDAQTILLIEWPEKAGQWLPEPDFRFKFAYIAQGRELLWLACSEHAGEQIKQIHPK